MNILRSVLAVICGYLTFALPAFAFFKLTGQPPHQSASLFIMLGSIATGMVAALCGGYAAAWIAQRRPAAHGLAVAVVLALGATASLINTLGHGAIWSQLAAIGLMAPCAAAGGWLRMRQLSAPPA